MVLADREAKRFENLTRLWRWHRLQFLMLGEGATAMIDDNHHSVADSRPPKSAGHEVRGLEQRWNNCATNEDRRRVLMDAQEILRYFKVPKADPHMVRDTVEWRRAIALDVRPASVLARKYKISKRTVYNYRREFKDERAAGAAA